MQQTLLSSALNTSIISQALNILTLGSYHDLSNLLVPVQNPSATVIAWGLAAFKWTLLAIAIFILFKAVCDRFKLKVFVPVVLTAVAVVAIFFVYNTPWNDAEIMSTRLSAFSNAFTNDPVNYTPSIMIHAINLMKAPIDLVYSGINTTMQAIPDNITAPAIQGGKLPTITSTNYDTSWLGFVVVIVVVGLIAYVVSRVSALASAILLSVSFLVLIGVNSTTVACVVLEFVFAVLAMYLAMHSSTRFLVPYPLSAMIIVAAYLIQPNKAVLVTMLMSAFILSLFPVFYSLGILLYAVGELVESRERIGTKIKPKKYIEEYASQYDPVMVAIVLLLLFTGVIVLFYLTAPGLGVFITTAVALLKS